MLLYTSRKRAASLRPLLEQLPSSTYTLIPVDGNALVPFPGGERVVIEAALLARLPRAAQRLLVSDNTVAVLAYDLRELQNIEGLFHHVVLVPDDLGRLASVFNTAPRDAVGRQLQRSVEKKLRKFLDIASEAVAQGASSLNDVRRFAECYHNYRTSTFYRHAARLARHFGLSSSQELPDYLQRLGKAA